MDNKQDRQFYWEVKDFMNKNPQNAPSSNSKPKVVDSVRQILEQNKIYQQSSFDAKSDAVNITNNIISFSKNAEKGYDNSSAAYTKNKDTHPFNTLNEGIFDFLFSPKALTPEQARENARKNRSKVKPLEQQFTASQANLPQISKEIDVEDKTYVPGTRLTPEQKAKRQLETQLTGERAEEEIRQSEAERILVGAPETQTNEKGSWFSPKPSWVSSAQKQIPVVEPESPKVSDETSEIPSEQQKPESGEFVGVDITQQTPEQIAAMNDPSRGGQSGRFGAGKPMSTPTTPTTPPEQEKYLEARKEYWRKRNVGRRQEAEENLARTQYGKPTTAYQAGSMAANRMKQQRAAEGGGDWSEEKIARMAAKETELRFRTPEQRAAKEKENAAVVASLSKAAEEVRAKEAKQKSSETRIA